MLSTEINTETDSKSNLIFGNNIKLLLNLQKQLQDVAIRHIGSDLSKSLQSIQQIQFIDARNKIDVPHGLFGLSLNSFYERRIEQENTVYIDVLQLVCKIALEQAKVCIVLDDIQDFVRNIFLGYRTKNMATILSDISNSIKLLTIHESIAIDFKKNSEQLKKLQEKLNAFNVRETNAVLYVNSQVNEAQNDCVEVELVLEPIEFRYKMSFHQRTTEQSIEKSRQIEEKLEKTLDNIEIAFNREDLVTDSIQFKQKLDIEVLKSRLEEMTEQYDREYENLDGQISYKTNAMDAMRDQYRDCLTKLEFYKSDIGRLRDWQEMWKQKKIDDANAELLKLLKQKKKKGSKKGKKKK